MTLFILFHYAQLLSSTIIFDTGSLVFNRAELEADITKAYTTLHVNSHLDSTSVYKESERSNLSGTSKRNQDFSEHLLWLGIPINLPEEMINGSEAFSYTILGTSRSTSAVKLHQTFNKGKFEWKDGVNNF